MSNKHSTETQNPWWWNSKLHLLMMIISITALGGSVGVLPPTFSYVWLAVFPYLAVGMYLDGRKIWKRYRGG